MTRLKFNKQFLARTKKQLPQLPAEKYTYFTSGGQSIVLKKGEDKILLATSYAAAKSIEIVRNCFSSVQSETSLAIPTLVGINVDIANLLDPVDPAAAMRNIKQDPQCHHTALFNTNIVYELPRYSGTLENIAKLRFKEDSITKLSNSLRLAVEELHFHGITHGDIALRNVFYSGEYPNYKFFLGDFGKASQNKGGFAKRSAEDLACLKRLIDKIQNKVTDKYRMSAKRQYIHQMLPSFSEALRRRKGLSPFVSEPNKNETKQTFKCKKVLKLV